MLDYTGIKCPVCDKPFAGDDDIVVCPVCGAPYHRDCYQNEGHCIFEETHASGKVWQPPTPPKPPASTNNTSYEIKDKECRVCGTLNAHSALFCNICGASLTGEPERHNNTPNYNNPNPQQPPFGQNPSFGFSRFAFDPMGGVSPTEKLDDNVTFGDVSKLVKQNTGYYMPVFKRIRDTGKGKFNFCAFLFSGGWMLYRKQYKLGAIITSIMFLLYLGYMMASLFVSAPVLADVMAELGIQQGSSVGLSTAELFEISNRLAATPALFVKFMLPQMIQLVMLAIMIFVGIRGNKLYMKHCIGTIQEIKSTENIGDINVAIEAKSGVNTTLAITLIICQMIISYIPYFI